MPSTFSSPGTKPETHTIQVANFPGVACEVLDQTSASGAMQLRCTCPVFQRSSPLYAPSCEHYMNVLVTHQDHPYLNSLAFVTERASIIVPLFKSPKLLVTVEVYPAEDITVPGTCFAHLLGSEGRSYALGYVSEKCSRWQLRSLVMEVLVEYADKQVWTCQSTLHGDDRLIEVKDFNSKRQLADLASVMLSDWCLTCAQNWEVPAV